MNVFEHKKKKMLLDFWLPVVYLLFNAYIIVLYIFTSALNGEACFG